MAVLVQMYVPCSFAVSHVLDLQDLCKAVRKQSRLYQESVRSLAELDDTTGVDLCAGQSAVRDRSMVAIKAEKMERARTYRRIMQVLAQTS